MSKTHNISNYAAPESELIRVVEFFPQVKGIESMGSHLGFRWVINKCGHRSAYVRIMPGHPWHGVDCYELNCSADVTFSDVSPNDDSWVIGFFDERGFSFPEMSRSPQEMEEDVKSLCEEAFDAQSK
jgi:hypothetical protein